MASAPVDYALSTLQLVCHLVTTGNSGIFTTTSGSIDLLSPTLARALPPGYIAYPDFGVAYKVHDEKVSWNVARDRCAQEGAHLAAIDSTAKIELVQSQPAAQSAYVHVGFYMKYGDDRTRYSVSTGLPVTNLPFLHATPDDGKRCAQISPILDLLHIYDCDDQEVYVCEIPYS